MSVSQVQETIQAAGFVHANPANPRNQRRKHPDGSEVQIHAYGNVGTTPFKSGNNAHIHESIGRHGDCRAAEPNDYGLPAGNLAEQHAGITNPANYPTVAGRPHGK
jgi:hypothetical protein